MRCSSFILWPAELPASIDEVLSDGNKRLRRLTCACEVMWVTVLQTRCSMDNHVFTLLEPLIVMLITARVLHVCLCGVKQLLGLPGPASCFKYVSYMNKHELHDLTRAHHTPSEK